jgi:hypothetical protein
VEEIKEPCALIPHHRHQRRTHRYQPHPHQSQLQRPPCPLQPLFGPPRLLVATYQPEPGWSFRRPACSSYQCPPALPPALCLPSCCRFSSDQRSIFCKIPFSPGLGGGGSKALARVERETVKRGENVKEKEER